MIRRANDDELEEIKLWSDHFFGDPYLSMEEYRKYSAGPDGFLYIFEENGEILSASMAFSENREVLMEDMDVTAEEWDRFCKDKKGVRLKFAWTKEKARGRRLALSVIEAILSDVEKQGTFGAVFTQLWDPKADLVPFEENARELGFRFLRHQRSPWYKQKYAHCRCSVCGGMCRCDADVYVKEFKQNG